LINWRLISDAIDWYKLKGYKYVEVPWAVKESTCSFTAPSEAQLFPISKSNDKYLVGSAEQSFVQLMRDGDIKPGKYVAATPCFRDEREYNNLTKPYFFKVELIDIGTEDFIVMMYEAKEFMDRNLGGETQLVEVETNEEYGNYTAYDLYYKGIELGSYGYRLHLDEDLVWSYGTGLAEPRFSYTKYL